MNDTEPGDTYETMHSYCYRPGIGGGPDVPEDCPHPALERVGRGRDGVVVIDLDCPDCGARGVHEDVRGRTSGGASA